MENFLKTSNQGYGVDESGWKKRSHVYLDE